MKRKNMIYSGVLVLGLVVVIFISTVPFSAVPIDEYVEITWTGFEFDETRDGGATDIVWDGTYLVVIGNLNDEIYKYTKRGVYTGIHFDVGDQSTYPTGITWDGTYYYITGYFENKVFIYTETGVYVNCFNLPVPSTNPSGITWDGSFFWITDGTDDEVYKFTSTGVYTEIHFDVSDQCTDPKGITSVETDLWVVDNDVDRAFKYSTTGIYSGDSFDVSQPPASASQGITWDGDSFWVICSNNDKIYEYSAIDGENDDGYILPIDLLPDTPVLEPIVPNPNVDGIITLSWYTLFHTMGGTFLSPVATSYDIFVCGVLIDTTTENTYTDKITTNGVYDYKIRANNDYGESEFSNIESVMVHIREEEKEFVPDAPILSPLTYVVEDGGTEIQLNWCVVDCDSYNVYKSVDGGSYVLIQSDLISTTYSEVLTEAGVYSYRITAENIYGESEPSNLAFITITEEGEPIEPIEPIDYTVLYVLSGVLGASVVITIILVKRKKRRS